MCNYGSGFTISDLYNLPTHLRMFYYKKLVESKQKEAEQMKEASKSSKPSKVRIKR
jgi:hypothetical protein